MINPLLQKLKAKKMQMFHLYLQRKKRQLVNHNYSPDQNGKKYLVVMACHCDSPVKLAAIRKNLRFVAFENMHKIVVNTIGLPYGAAVADLCSRHANTVYYEIPNSGYYDFGKWVHALQQTDYHAYDYVVFLNDSVFIHRPINAFLNLTAKHNVELFGYNDSTQMRYHYQSYLFSLRKDAVAQFIAKVTDPALKIQNQGDVIAHFELGMTDWFAAKKSFLKIGAFGLNRGQNIFFTNDELYAPLRRSGLLPFTKIKRMR